MSEKFPMPGGDERARRSEREETGSLEEIIQRTREKLRRGRLSVDNYELAASFGSGFAASVVDVEEQIAVVESQQDLQRVSEMIAANPDPNVSARAMVAAYKPIQSFYEMLIDTEEFRSLEVNPGEFEQHYGGDMSPLRFFEIFESRTLDQSTYSEEDLIQAQSNALETLRSLIRYIRLGLRVDYGFLLQDIENLVRNHSDLGRAIEDVELVFIRVPREFFRKSYGMRANNNQVIYDSIREDLTPFLLGQSDPVKERVISRKKKKDA